MAQQKTLDAVIRLMGQTTPSFVALGTSIETLGARIDAIGGKIREFEKESLAVYRSYEDNMLSVRGSLTKQYESATELNRVMGELDAYASDWASHTIFHTDDVSQAMSEAANAGWDYTRIIKGIPQAMLIAQAGGMDLSTGLDYLVKMMNATNTSFDDAGTVVDQWAKAAKSSATTIDEMGEAFMAMGAAAQFGDSTAELFTMLALLANVGTTGSQAGTAVRNAMMRLIAPTTKAENAMELLGADADELEQVLTDENVTKAAKMLEGLGFSAYDANGNLKPMLTIFQELFDVTKDLDEATRNELIAAIFPTRTIATALTMLKSASGEMQDLYGSISDSEGYAQKLSDIMMSGLTGSVETLLSKGEEFERRVGNTLAPNVESLADSAGSILDFLNGLDETAMSTLVGGLTGLASVGGGLMVTGAAIKLLGTLGPVGIALLAIGVGAGALAGYLTKLNEVKFEDHFGSIILDLDTLGDHVDSLKTNFTLQQEAMAAWETGLNEAEEKYAGQATRLSELLLEDVLTGKSLTQTEKDNLEKYTDSLYQAVIDGLDNANAKNMTLLDAIFGDGETFAEENAGNAAAQVVQTYFDKTYQEAYKIGAELRKQLTKALKDDVLDENERMAIQATVSRYDEIMAQIANTQDREAYNRQLYKARNVSWDSISAYLEENETKQASEIASVSEEYEILWAHLRTAFDMAMEAGDQYVDLFGKTRPVTEETWAEVEAELLRNQAQAEQDVIDKYAGLGSRAFDALMHGSDMSAAWDLLRRIGTGRSITEADLAGYSNEEIENIINGFSSIYDNEGRLMEAAPDIEKGLLAANRDIWRDAYDIYEDILSRPEEAEKALQEERTQIDETKFALAAAKGELGALLEERDRLVARIYEKETSLQNEHDHYNWLYALFGGYAGDRAALYGTATQGGLYDDLDAMTAKIAEAEAQVTALQEELNELRNPVVIPVSLDTGSFKSNVIWGGKQYAEGGRATQPSIFGEVPGLAEWAIPEAHTERTAQLLNAARQASGFTWNDLLTRFGGLNANPKNQSVVLHYSPVINAGNAEGVAAALAADKQRIMRMLRDIMAEQRVRDEVELYA